MSDDHITDAITAVRPSLSPGAQRIADAVMSDPAGTSQLSIVELAKLTDSSVGSVSRFCRTLGLDGYTAFRMALAREAGRDAAADPDFDASGEIEPGTSVGDAISLIAASSINALRRTAALVDERELERLAGAVHDARHVQIFAFGGSGHIAGYLAGELTGIGILALTTQDVNNAAAYAVTLTDDDVAIGISHSGTAQHAIDLVKLARRRGAFTAAITSSLDTPLARAAGLTLATTARTASSRYRGTAGRHAQLFITDALYVRVAQRRFDQSRMFLDLAGDATAQFQIKS